MSSVDRKELDAVSNHISNIPSIGAVYAPVLVEHCRALLAEVERLTAELHRMKSRPAEAEFSRLDTMPKRGERRIELAALPVDHEADAMFDALQPSLGTPVAPERRIRRQADVDAAFARGAESMRAAAVAVASKRANLQRFTDSDCAWGRSAECIRDELRHLPVPEDKS